MSYLVDSVRDEIVEVCHQLYLQGMLAACDGNVSVRLDDSRLLITPSGVHKGHLDSGHFAVVDFHGNTVAGHPSSELAIHLAVYRACPEARAVIHAHPPAAIAWTIAHPDSTELPSGAMSELILAVGQVPIIPYKRPGSTASADALLPYITRSKVCLLSRHGCLCWGTSLSEATWGVERLEHAAKTLSYAQTFGGITSLPQQEIDQLHELRAKLGDRVL